MLGARPRVIIGLAVGIALAAALVVHTGLPTFAAAIAALSWPAIGVACLFQAGSIILCSLAWWILTEGSGLGAVTIARWIREGSSTLLAVVPGIGEIAGGRALALAGTRAGDVAASTVVDVVVDTGVMAILAVGGVVPLLAQAGIARASYGAAVGAAAAVLAAGIYLLWRSRSASDAMRRAVSYAGRKVGLTTGDVDLAQRIALIHGRRRHMAVSAGLHLAAWLLGAVQLWAAAAMLGIPLSPLDAFSLHMVGSAARGIFFVVPMGAGVQEVSFVVVGALVGVSEADALALSLLSRARDLAVALPAMALWALAELRASGRSAAGAAAPGGDAPAARRITRST